MNCESIENIADEIHVNCVDQASTGNLSDGMNEEVNLPLQLQENVQEHVTKRMSKDRVVQFEIPKKYL